MNLCERPKNAAEVSPPSHSSSAAALLAMTRRVAAGCALAAIALAALVLIGWIAGVHALTTMSPGAPAMRVNAALGVLAGGVAVLFTARGRAPVLARAAALGAGMLGALTLFEWITGAGLGLDTLQSRMAPNSAEGLVLTAIGVLGLRARRHRRVAVAACLLGGALGLLAVVGHITGVSRLYGIHAVAQMSLPTAVSLVLLNAGTFSLLPSHGSLTLLVSPRKGGWVLRRMLPVALGLPLALYAVRAGLQDLGAFQERVGDWLFVLALMAIFAAVVFQLARSLDVTGRRLDAQHAVTRVLAQAGSIEAGVPALLREIGEGLRWDAAILWLADRGEDVLVCGDAWHSPGAAGEGFVARARRLLPARGDGVAGAAWAAGETVWAQRGDRELRTRVCTPVVSGGHVAGVLELGARGVHRADDDMVELLESLAALVGEFLQRRRAEERVAGQAHRLAQAAGFSRALAREQDPEAIRSALCANVREITGAAAALVFEPDDAGNLVLTAGAGTGAQVGLTVPLSGEPSGVGRAYLAGEAVYIDDAHTDAQASERIARSGLRSGVAVPVFHEESCIAVLGIAFHAPRLRGWDDVSELVELLASEAALAMERADLHTRLHAAARTDQLTGLANRRAWDEELPRELARARRDRRSLSVALLDLDHFKAFNDLHGHQAGDRLLRETAAVWAARLRATDTLARYGGEEFVLALPGCDARDADVLLAGLREGMPGGVTCSIGVAAWDGTESADELVGRADAALYAAKRGGRDRVVAG